MTERIEKQSVIYRFGRFEMSVNEGILRSNGEIVPLTPKIFEMLLLLVRNNGRMLSKDEIMQSVWADSFVEETNLTSNVSRLRKILQDNGEQFIETFPKRGYLFRAEVEEIEPETEIIVSRRTRKFVRQIVEETDESDFQTAYTAALRSQPNNLTIPATPLVGRTRQIEEIENLLRQPKNRIVTLSGVGGTGKTRLAQEIACRRLSEFVDGAFFVALDAVRSAALVPSAIAETLGVKEMSGKTIVETLKNFLREKQILLVADNFEQIVSAAPFLTEILDHAPQLKILVTSRVLLGIPAEREFRVPPLNLPESAAQTSLENLIEFESVKLFIERAKSVKSTFALTVENAASVAEICRSLEGLPLAIELAAARIKILSPEQILTRLENRLKLLTGGAKSLPARQQTMRGAIEWSYDLLAEDEKTLFRCLAVFAGGFTIEAVESICVSKDIDALNCLTSLIENSLVVQTETANDESRFRLLEVVREYAHEVLEESGESNLIKQKHAAFYLALAKEAEPKLYGEQTTKWLNRLEEEHGNIRAVLSWSVVNDVKTAIDLAGAVRRFWILHNHLTEGRKWHELALEQDSDASADAHFKLLYGIGQAALYQGDDETARKIFEESLATSTGVSDVRQIALLNRALGVLAKKKGNIAAARKFIEDALKISREADDKFGIAVSLNNLGDLARMENDFAAARPLLEEALALSRQLGNKEGICCSLNNLGASAYGEGDYKASRSHYTEAIMTAHELGDKVSVSYSLDGFAALALQKGNLDCAAQLAGAAEHLRETLGFDTEPAERRFRDAYLNKIRSALDEETFLKACAEGSAMRLEKAVLLAGAL